MSRHQFPKCLQLSKYQRDFSYQKSVFAIPIVMLFYLKKNLGAMATLAYAQGSISH
jgi:hypothetical protein